MAKEIKAPVIRTRSIGEGVEQDELRASRRQEIIDEIVYTPAGSLWKIGVWSLLGLVLACGAIFALISSARLALLW